MFDESGTTPDGRSLFAALQMAHPWWQHAIVLALLVIVAFCLYIAETD